MDNVKGILQHIGGIIEDIIKTALDVNKFSYLRRDKTRTSLDIIKNAIEKNIQLKALYDQVSHSLMITFENIIMSSDGFNDNVRLFNEMIDIIAGIKTNIDALQGEILKFVGIVDEIRNDTDEIFMLALNASIAASKYSHTSGVFDKLADKLNEMSFFINRNLENILLILKPITDGIENIVKINSVVQSAFSNGHTSFMQFNEILASQRGALSELLDRAGNSGPKIDDQRTMLDELYRRLLEMDEHASGAIIGSGNVAKTGKDMKSVVGGMIKAGGAGDDYADVIKTAGEQARIVWSNATSVNEKSMSQLDFSLSSVEFCDTMIAGSRELKTTVEVFNNQFSEGHRVIDSMHGNMSDLNRQLSSIENMIDDSRGKIEKFAVDFQQMDTIIGFLKNILQSMNIIGILSRIESSRDPDEYKGFITISDKIVSLQDRINNNIHSVEKNIESAHELIGLISGGFESIMSEFLVISGGSGSIIEKLEETADISTESGSLSNSVMDESRAIVSMLNSLSDMLNDLTEIVKKPIEGSAANMERGKKIEELCGEIAQL